MLHQGKPLSYARVKIELSASDKINLRQHSVIVYMVPVVTRGIGQDQSFKPLDASPSNLAWHNNPKRTSMVWTQRLSVHFVSEHYSFVGVHCPIQFDRGPIVAIRL